MTLTTVEEALACVLAHARPRPPEDVPIDAAAGRRLAVAAVACTDLPPFPSSAMDGYALRAADAPGRLRVAFRIAAGRAPTGPLPHGCCAAISTGGVVPDGADAVIPLERVRIEDETVVVPETVSPGAHVRERGGDVRAGASILDPGTLLGPAQVGALAAAGVASVSCHAQPRVTVLATGSELKDPGHPLEPGQIYESNSHLLAAAVASAGAVVERLPVVADDEDEHRAALEHGLASDVLVTTGGVSVGPHDLVRAIERELGVEEVFWGVAMKPGKPISFGVRGSTLVFGLPGNPVSALVGAVLFVLPVLDALQGAPAPSVGYETGVLARSLPRRAERDEFVRARRTHRDDDVLLEPISGQESHMIVRAASADALVRVPRGQGELSAGTRVRYVPLA